MILILLASTLLQLCTGQNLVADLHISEHGAEYNERVEYDPITKAVTYQVPKHNDIVASTTIIHKPTVCSVQPPALLNSSNSNNLGFSGGI